VSASGALADPKKPLEAAAGGSQSSVTRSGPSADPKDAPSGLVAESSSFSDIEPNGAYLPGYGEASWNYTSPNTNPTTGPVGPAGWSSITTVAGKLFDAPVDITTPAKDLSRVLRINYTPAVPELIVNTGHQIRVHFKSSTSDTVTVGRREYTLSQFHLHEPAENTLHGTAPRMEAHFVNVCPTGAEAVLGVFLEQGAHNDALDPVLSAASEKLKAAGSQTTIKVPIDFSGLLPTNRQGWCFRGSLTTPPLSRPVNWFVFKTPITLDAKQLAEYEKVASGAGFLPNARPTKTPKSSQSEIELVFTYGSEKYKSINEVTRQFNASGRTLPSGERIKVVALPVGSGELIDEVLTQRRKAHLVCPASSAFVLLGNAESRQRGQGDLIGPTTNVVTSPVVVAMWREMAEAIGWPGKSLKWHDIFQLARDASQWRKVSKPQWGSFKFGHTHPDLSNSGLVALFAETYAALDKFDGVTGQDISNQLEKVSSYLRGVENSIVHYGTSTGFFADRMFSAGPSYLSAAILYENLVIQANQEAQERNPAVELPQIVAIYPKEGTFLSDHPIGVVQRPWVTEKHRQACQSYIDFLLERPRQELAVQLGFRPSSNQQGIGVKPILRPEFGVSPTQPRKLLQPPPASAILMIQDLWRLNKRNADIVLAVDTSASMEGERIHEAESAAKAFIDFLGPGDLLSALIFGTKVEWMSRDLRMDHQGKEEAMRSIDHLLPDGDTPLYQAIDEAYEFLLPRDPSRTRALIVLSDGKDTRQTPTLEKLLEKFDRANRSGSSILIFTIGYGSDADPQSLSEIAKRTNGKYYEGSTSFPGIERRENIDSIRKVFTELATFF
jgi:Ca-activated chloride channel family protein